MRCFQGAQDFAGPDRWALAGVTGRSPQCGCWIVQALRFKSAGVVRRILNAFKEHLVTPLDPGFLARSGLALPAGVVGIASPASPRLHSPADWPARPPNTPGNRLLKLFTTPITTAGQDSSLLRTLEAGTMASTALSLVVLVAMLASAQAGVHMDMTPLASWKPRSLQQLAPQVHPGWAHGSGKRACLRSVAQWPSDVMTKRWLRLHSTSALSCTGICIAVLQN